MDYTRTSLVNNVPCMATSEVSRRLGIVVSVKLLKEIGFEPLMEAGPGTFWRESEFNNICAALARYVAMAPLRQPLDLDKQSVVSALELWKREKGAPMSQLPG